MKQRILVSFEPEELYRLKRIAREDGKSVSEVVREAVGVYTVKEKKNPAQVLLEWREQHKAELAKAFKGVDPDLSKKIDEIVYGI